MAITGGIAGVYRAYTYSGRAATSSNADYSPAESIVKVEYRLADSDTAKQDIFTGDSIDFDLTPEYQESIVPGSVRFKLGGRTYVDRNGSMYYSIDPTTGAGIHAGTIDYSSGNVNLTDWVTNASNVLTVESLLTSLTDFAVERMDFRVPSAPVKVQSLQIRVTPEDGGGEITAVSNSDQTITGTGIVGIIDYETGFVSLNFGEYVVAAGNEGEPWYHIDNVDGLNVWKPIPVLASTMLFNAVSQTFLPLDESILGLNPVRLPEDGRIPVYSDGDIVVILHDQTIVGTYVNAEVLDFGRGRIAKLKVRDAANQPILETKYTADLDVGTITFDDVAGISQPITTIDRIEDMSVVSDVQITGKLTLTQPLTHDFPVDETLVSNAVIYGDLYAHTSIPFDQVSWTNTWSDVQIGDGATAQYNNSQYPIAVDNASAIEERWVCIFSSSTTVNVIGENVGQILSGVSIGTDIAPINPNTLQPFFTIPLDGWGSGWSAGNCLRFNTKGANAPAWIILSVGQGDATDPDFGFCTELRGDVNTP